MQRNRKMSLRIIIAFSLCAVLSVSAFPIAYAGAETNASSFTNLYDYETAGSYSNYIWHNYSDFIEVNGNDEIYIGPCMPNQGFHISDFGASKSTVRKFVGMPDMKLVSSFPNGQVILKWTVPSDTKYIRVANTTTSDRVFVITKNEPFDCDSFYAYWEKNNVDCSPYVKIGYENPTPEKDIENLFDKDKTDKGAYSNDGKLVSGEYISTSLIPVKQGDVVYFGQTNLMDDYQLKTFDASEKPIQGRIQADKCRVVDIFSSWPDTVIMSYEIQEGTAYIAASCLNTFASNYLLTKNQPFNTETLKTFFNGSLPESPSYDVKEDSPLKDKKVGFFGDSVCSAEIERNDPKHSHVRGWAGRIGVTNDMDFVNYGVSGASVSNCRQQNTIINQLKKAKGKKLDFVILHGGVNDAWDAVPVGKAGDKSLSKFAGGLEEVLSYAEENFPDAAIGYVLNFKYTKACKGKLLNRMAEYVKVTKELCDSHSIKYLDLYSDDELTETLNSESHIYLYDTVHPTSAGYDLIYPKIEEFMIGLMQKDDPAESPEPEENPESEDSKESTENTENVGKNINRKTLTIIVAAAVLFIAFIVLTVFLVTSKKSKKDDDTK